MIEINYKTPKYYKASSDYARLFKLLNDGHEVICFANIFERYKEDKNPLPSDAKAMVIAKIVDGYFIFGQFSFPQYHREPTLDELQYQWKKRDVEFIDIQPFENTSAVDTFPPHAQSDAVSK